jgi:Arc/MetJ-type ribon-helix-helix transcriptional regulator
MAPDDPLQRVVTARVSTGRYEAIGETPRGFPLLEQRRAQVAAVSAALKETEQGGEPERLDFDEFVREQRALDGR